MVSINNQTKEINCKIVYYGPGLGGKTTNLLVIHKKVPKSNKSEMVSLATESDRTLFFDYLPLDLGKIKGFETKFQLYTVPGQVYYNETRKLVLRGVDGIVFVADSQRSKLQESIDSYQNLENNLRETGLSLAEIPHVIQYNKRDMPDVVSVDELERALNHHKVPYFEAVAFKTSGVFNTLKAISKIVINKYNSSAGVGVSAGKFKKKNPDPAAPPPPSAVPPAPPEKNEVDIDDDIQNYIRKKKQQSEAAGASPEVMSPPPQAPPTPPTPHIPPPPSAAFVEPDGDDNFVYTPDSPGYTGVSDELSDENEEYLDIKPYTGMDEGDLPPPRSPGSKGIDFDPYGDNSGSS